MERSSVEIDLLKFDIIEHSKRPSSEISMENYKPLNISLMTNRLFHENNLTNLTFRE